MREDKGKFGRSAQSFCGMILYTIVIGGGRIVLRMKWDKFKLLRDE